MEKELSPEAMIGLGVSLKSFTVKKFFEVYQFGDGTSKEKSLAILSDEILARLYLKEIVGKGHNSMRPKYVLTDGNITFLLGDYAEVVDVDDIVPKIKKKIVGKLDPDARALLGLG